MSRESTQRKRPKNQYMPWLRFFFRLLIVAAVILVIVLIWRNWNKIAPEAILDWSEIRFGDAEIGAGFPTAVEGNNVVSMGEVGQHFAVLSDTNLMFYNTSATRVVTRPHSFSSPVMHTAGKYVLLAEIGGSRFQRSGKPYDFCRVRIVFRYGRCCDGQRFAKLRMRNSRIQSSRCGSIQLSKP